MADQEQRDRVRALVREVLKNSVTDDDLRDEQASTESKFSPTATPSDQKSRFISVAPLPPPKSVEPEVSRDESSKRIITEDDVRGLEAGARLRIAENAHLTPLAADIVREKRIELVRRPARRGNSKSRTVAVASDHGGFEMKEHLKGVLTGLGHQVRDFGTNSKEAVDYPDFAHAAAKAVSEGVCDVAVIIDGAGVGSAMTANKVPGVRAAACYSVAVAKNSREHNDANVLTLGSGTIDKKLMEEIVAAWMSTEIAEERHKKRVAKIEAIERQYQRC